MRGLPDSAIYGTYKRATRGRRSSNGEGFFEFMVELYVAYKRYKAHKQGKTIIR